VTRGEGAGVGGWRRYVTVEGRVRRVFFNGLANLPPALSRARIFDPCYRRYPS
jgi:hypothetical protein